MTRLHNKVAFRVRKLPIFIVRCVVLVSTRQAWPRRRVVDLPGLVMIRIGLFTR